MSDLPPPHDPPMPPPSAAPPPPPPPGGPGVPPPPPNLTPPPGYTAYATAPTPTATISRIGGVAKASIVLTAITCVAVALGAVFSPSAAQKAKDYLDGEISEQDFLDGYNGVAIAQMLQGLLTIAAGVLSIIWLYRVASNVRAFGRATTWAPLWAVFGWVVPPILVIIPFLMLREMWKASAPDVPPGDPSWKSRSAEEPVLWAWFVLYGIVPAVLLAFQVQSLAATGLGGDTEDIAEAIDSFGTVEILGVVATVLSGIAWIVFVRRLTDRHTRLTNER